VNESALLAYDRARGVRFVAGVDEVGRACWAGPIMAAGVLLDLDRLASAAGGELLEELDDSKRLGPAMRERLADAVIARAEVVSLVSIPASDIDRIGLQAANIACLERALRAIAERAELRLVDGNFVLGDDAPEHERIIRGDGTSAAVAAASIVAKVARDRLMDRLAERYPGYGFERNKGYGTKEHEAAVVKLGPTPEHRLSLSVRCFTGAAVVAARPPKPRRTSWRQLPVGEMASHLLETPTINDRAWTDEPRLRGETRTAFIRRVLLGETKPV
jgi:ribonuclease HII